MAQISGNGIITVDGTSVEDGLVYYWLDVCDEPGDLIAEGSIHGSEVMLRKVKKANRAVLEPEAGPRMTLKCEGGKNGVRWVKALRT
jgi:hypothetical protein